METLSTITDAFGEFELVDPSRRWLHLELRVGRSSDNWEEHSSFVCLHSIAKVNVESFPYLD